MKNIFSKLVWFSAAILVCSSLVYAQTQIGGASLNGVVTDPSNAVVASAKVTVHSAATGFTRSVDTTSAGLYSFSGLPAGEYDLTIEAPGFKMVVHKNLVLTVGALVTIDQKLEIGARSCL